MIKIGHFNTLRVLKERDFGLFLDGGDFGDILLPRRHVPEDAKLGDLLKVFIYLNSDDKPTATTKRPYVKSGEFACLKVTSVNNIGAFLDWGLPKELLAPFGEQQNRMEEGKRYLVHVYQDERSQRLVASSKVERFLDQTPADYQAGEEVELLIANGTELGIKAIVNGLHWGVLYRNELFREVRFGQKVTGYIKRIRPDGKLDLTLNPPGYAKVEDLSDILLNRLREEGGFMALNDKTSPEIIQRLFGCSKKSFKMALGRLYKQKRVSLENDGIRLLDNNS